MNDEKYQSVNPFMVILLAVIVNMVILPFTSWWLFVFPSFASGWLSINRKSAAMNGGTGAMIPWIILNMYYYFSGGSLIMERVSHMMNLHSTGILLSVSILIPLILGGLSGLSGYLYRTNMSIQK